VTARESRTGRRSPVTAPKRSATRSPEAILTLPDQLRRSLTWDQGAEMAQHARLRIDAGLAVYFCDPQSPWQRGTNENTNGLLRQYFPRGTDLARHSPDDLAAVAAALNTRPRKTLGFKTPAEVLDEYLATMAAT
jgi:IS30 family transposase